MAIWHRKSGYLGATAPVYPETLGGFVIASGSFIEDIGSSSAGSTYTFSSQSLGTAGNRMIVLAGAYNYATNSPMTNPVSATIGDVSASLIYGTEGAGWERSFMFYAYGNLPATGDIVLTFSESINNGCGIGVYQIPASTLVDSFTEGRVDVTSAYSVSLAGLPANATVVYSLTSGTASSHTYSAGTNDYFSALGASSGERSGLIDTAPGVGTYSETAHSNDNYSHITAAAFV